jgi:hypothetical protein
MRPVNHFVNNISPPAMCKTCGQVHGFGEANTGEFIKADVSPDLYDDYAGKYKFDDGMVLTVYRESDKFMVFAEGLEPAEYLPVSGKEFRSLTEAGNISFERNKRNKVTHLVLYDLDEIIAKKIE